MYRIIPTRVGTRYDCQLQYLCQQDHPHACGDKLHHSLHSSSVPGSSPRVWGQAEQTYVKRYFVRIIPTRVGTSPAGQTRLVSTRDHPHACGDKIVSSIASVAGGGSSPRVWGQVASFLRTRLWDRIIPTRVGTRSMIPVPASAKRDHPHACGDKNTPRLHFLRPTGSSPRVWGQGFPLIIFPICHRIIPTRVGTSRLCPTVRWHTKDHPHACGDKMRATAYLLCGRGSSPRVWGQVLAAWNTYKNDRIIPTRVGTSVHIFLMTLRQ